MSLSAVPLRLHGLHDYLPICAAAWGSDVPAYASRLPAASYFTGRHSLRRAELQSTRVAITMSLPTHLGGLDFDLAHRSGVISHVPLPPLDGAKTRKVGKDGIACHVCYSSSQHGNPGR